MKRRNVYLEMKSVADARSHFLARFPWATRRAGEEVPVADAVGRVLCEPVHARVSSPSYHGAAMDGVAVQARDTWGASDLEPLDLDVGERAIYVNTGDPVPEGFDAVVMIEDVQVLDERTVRIEAAAYPWQHVRKVGEDIVATEMLFPRSHRVTPWCIGALLAGGVSTVPVVRRPRVLVIPTGSEMVSPETLSSGALPAGAIIESNSTVIARLVESRGGTAERHDGLRDDADEIGRVIADAAETFDAVLVIGGSSAGSRDFTKTAIERAGGEVMMHGVTVMPGKPTLLGAAGETPVVGIPGYPVSAIVAFEEFVAPALDAMLGVQGEGRPVVRAIPSRKIASKLGMEELVRVRLGRVGEHMVASPLPRGAGTVTSITKADGILRIGTDLEGVHPDREVDVELLRPRADIEKNLVAVGSHDLCLDVIDDMLHELETGVSLSSTHVGSLGGLLALKNGRCHLAGSHLLDPTDGSYNRSWIEKHLPEVPVKLVHLVTREQGLMVRRGNPHQIESIEDLTQEDVTFINRQSGSGTRVLLDYELERCGIDAAKIAGYEIEEFTHMAVAVAVLSGAADVGMGILAAARALELDFIPVTSERYELVVREEFFETPPVQRLLGVIRDTEFIRRVEMFGGYGTSESGHVV